VLVKMEEKPFGAGAMRECYAMKKLSTFAPHRNWEEAQNMVVRAYVCVGVCVCVATPLPNPPTMSEKTSMKYPPACRNPRTSCVQKETYEYEVRSLGIRHIGVMGR
jgi:hypothetical protein